MKLSASQSAIWATCEAMAMADPPVEGRPSAAALVGTVAHAKLAGLGKVQMPRRVAWDNLTQSHHHLITQAESIAVHARYLLWNGQWAMIEQEEPVVTDDYTGHLDIRAWHPTMGESVIDLKTGQQIGAAWLQVGAYIAASRTPVQLGGVLHIPRVSNYKDAKGHLLLRPAEDLVKAWQTNLQRIIAVQRGATPTYSPGLHCRRCSLTSCAVRA